MPTPHKRIPMLDGAPWPQDVNGKYLNGTTVIVMLVNFHGIGTEICMERSSGNTILDKDAVHRMMHRSFKPAMKEGWPINSYARIPVSFNAFGYVMAVPSPPSVPEQCSSKPVPGVSPAELALSHDTEITIHPTSDDKVPGTGLSWPTDAKNDRVQLNVDVDVLLDSAGNISTIDNVKSGYAAFDAFTSTSLSHATFLPSDRKHWHGVAFHFRRPD